LKTSGKITGTEEIVESILRGSAKILGCTSASLIMFDEADREVRLRVGTIAESLQPLAMVEEMVGELANASFRFSDVDGSLVFRSWRDRTVLETCSLAELAGNAFGDEVLGPVSALIGERRFICVPVLTGSHCHGLIVFEKAGSTPFSRQQRELLLQYAQRIGEIIEGGSTAQARPGSRGTQSSSPDVFLRVLVDMEGSAGGSSIDRGAGSEVAAVFVDPDFRITSCNDAVERLFGYSSGELTDRNIEALFKDRQQVKALLNKQFLFLSDGYFEEGIVLRQKGGRFMPARVKALLLADRSDRFVGFLVLIREYSSMADGDKDGDGAERLMRRERLATMGEMAAQLAHELRNPLVSIGATLEHIASDVANGNDVVEAVADVRAEIDRMDMILKTYLSIAARRKTKIEHVDLAATIEDAIRLLAQSRAGADRTIVSEVPAGLQVLADPDGLSQVFFNVLLNALEATSPGDRIICSGIDGGDDVTIHVDDTGQGLSCEPFECFEMFYTTRKNGTGLGLAVCRKIVESHGGVVTLINRKEGGCRATIVLPRKVKI